MSVLLSAGVVDEELVNLVLNKRCRVVNRCDGVLDEPCLVVGVACESVKGFCSLKVFDYCGSGVLVYLELEGVLWSNAYFCSPFSVMSILAAV